MKTVRDSVIIGLLIGIPLAIAVYVFLSAVDSQLREEMSNEYGVSYQSLVMSKGLDVCGLDSQAACDALAGKSGIDTFSSLKAVTASQNALQPYHDVTYEDELTATQIIQPTDPKRPVVTLNGSLIQGSL